VPLAETLGAFAELIEGGKVRHVAASNYNAPRLAEALRVADAEGLPRYVALQPHYSLVERGEFEGPLQDLCRDEELGVFSYWGLARGFLTGKYRPGGEEVDSPRAGAASGYLDARGIAVLEALDEVAAAHAVEPAAVALAWLRAQPTVLAPIASARNTTQLGPLIAAAGLELSGAELERLGAASS
jgi:aryl-alcohol dehydrogenase-like predicted oxidoreductase